MKRRAILESDPEMKATEYVRGKGFVEWLENDCRETLVQSTVGETLMRRIWSWRHDDTSLSIYTADRLLTKLGRHVTEIPDHLYTSAPYGAKVENRVKRRKQMEEAAALIDGGATFAEVGRKYGLSARTIKYWHTKVTA